MKQMNNYKRILDSVHGYINIPVAYCDNIIDTVQFQRLRRIEQTSGRSLFPSARHDRFIHSLGVFYLGGKIVDSIKCRYPKFVDADTDDMVYESYVLACLLHDICHSPFSHTFEKFYGLNTDLRKLLEKGINDNTFEEDWNECFDSSAPHEIMSALMVVRIFKGWIENNTKANVQLIARMIVGCKYIKQKEKKSFENAFIDLIHGDIIDADGLDYVCRDAWASGYCTNNIDVDRLIDSICIERDVAGCYSVCYTTKALNEIEAVLNVKSFQQTNVITHHTVVYEQELLVKAMESAALFHIINEKDVENRDRREKALTELCDVESFYSEKKFEGSNARLIYPMDDDFVSLMKYIPKDRYVRQWLNRQYELKPLWKSKADFFNAFDILIDKKYSKGNWLFSDKCADFISKEFSIDRNSIWIVSANAKDKRNLASKVDLFIDGRLKRYTDLYKNDKNSFVPNLMPFSYIYVPIGLDEKKIVEKLRTHIESFVFS